MVDIIKPFPYVSTLFPSNIHNQRAKFSCQTLNLGTNDSSIRNQWSDFERSNFVQPKRWIGNCANNPPRLLDVSYSPYRIHRKIMQQELSRYFPAKMTSLKSAQNKQQQEKPNTMRDPPKTPIPVASNITSQGSFSHGDTQSSRLFETLSKHVTVKAEPLRPSNSFVNSSTNTLTSWQKYWSSSHTQRRRKEASETDSMFHRIKRETTIPGQTHFVVLRDSPIATNIVGQSTSPTLTSTISHTPVESDISTIIDKTEIKIMNEESNKKTIKGNIGKKEGAKKLTHTLSTVEFVASSVIPSSFDLNSSTIASRISIMHPVKTIPKEENKEFTEKSLLISSSQFRSDSELIEEVSQAQIQPKPVITKVYKLAVVDDKSNQQISLPSHTSPGKTRSKSKDKSPQKQKSKQQRPVSNKRKSKAKCNLSEAMTTASKLNLSQHKWDEPYVGLRFDPPTPPSSPSLFVWLDDSDPDNDDDRLYEKSEILVHDLLAKNRT